MSTFFVLFVNGGSQFRFNIIKMPISRYRRQCQRHQCTIRWCNLFPASVNSFPFSFFRLFKFPLHIASSLRARGNACAVTNNCKQHILPIPIFSGDIQFYYITLFVSHKHTHTLALRSVCECRCTSCGSPENEKKKSTDQIITSFWLSPPTLFTPTPTLKYFLYVGKYG